jgi:hypothetical protein
LVTCRLLAPFPVVVILPRPGAGPATRRSTLSSLQPAMAMLGLPTSAAEPEHVPMPGSDCVGAQPRAVPDRDIIGTSAHHERGRPCSPTSTSPSRRCVFHPAWPVDHRGPVPPCRVSPLRSSLTAGRWGRLALLAARADEPAVTGRSGQHRPVADLLAIGAAGGVLALALVRGPAPTGLGAAAYRAAMVLYVLIALVVVHSSVADSACWPSRCGWRRCCKPSWCSWGERRLAGAV